MSTTESMGRLDPEADIDILDIVRRCELDLEGGTTDDGMRIVSAIQKKYLENQETRDILIEAETVVVDGVVRTQARDTGLNRGLAIGFGIATEHDVEEKLTEIHEHVGEFALGNTGFSLTFTAVESFDFDEEENRQFREAFTRSNGIFVLPRPPFLLASVIK